MITVLIVEDSAISKDFLERQLSLSPDYCILASIENAANAEIACMRSKIDLILMDICTADDESGLLAAEKIKRLYTKIRIIMMTSMPEYSFIEKARSCGCDGFWYKEASSISLLEICDRVMKGERIYPDHSPIIKIGLASSSEFTDRELAVIRELTGGGSYEEIAETLHMSTNTVKYHVKNILQKTGFRTTMRLVAEVVEKLLVLPKY